MRRLGSRLASAGVAVSCVFAVVLGCSSQPSPYGNGIPSQFGEAGTIDASAPADARPEQPPTPDAGCVPSAATTPKWAPPAVAAGSCSGAELSLVYSLCLGSSATMQSCAVAANDYFECYKCLHSRITDATWGPWLDTGSIQFLNTGGCIALLDPANQTCATAFESIEQCEAAACAPCSYDACWPIVDNGECAGYATTAHACAAAVPTGDPASVCTDWTTFEDGFMAIADIFCGGTSDAGDGGSASPLTIGASYSFENLDNTAACMSAATDGGPPADGALIVDDACGSATQAFTVTDAGQGLVSLVEVETGRCVDIQGDGTADHTPVDLYDCNGTPAQAFIAVNAGHGAVTFVSPQSGRCLNLTNGSTALLTPIQLYDCNLTNAQRWYPIAPGMGGTASDAGDAAADAGDGD